MLLVIDNYDSFTYNLVQYFGELGAEIAVHRNDKISLGDIQKMAPSHICISPGPGTPSEDSGISNAVIAEFGKTTPVFGVCLGQQCMGHVFGGDVIRAPRLMHGKTSPVKHDGQGVFKDIPSPFTATRYHSLIVQEPLPDHLIATAHTEEGELMGVRHREYPIHGVQFHPESILTEYGKEILGNFLKM